MRKSSKLRELFKRPGVVKVAGANDGLTAILSEKAGFDAVWAGGLAISAAHGVPDISILTMTDFLAAARVINDSTDLPVIADCDTGFGGVNNAVRMVQQYESSGIAAVCIEDKVFPKRNSFLPGQELANVHEFAAKIRAAKDAQKDPDFMVIARLESLIAGAGMADAVHRANVYSNAGADAILIHSKARTPGEVLEFAQAWRGMGFNKPLVVVPTTYASITVDELEQHEIKCVIYANHALRATITAVNNTLAAIVKDGTSANVEEKLASVGTVFQLIGTPEADRLEQWFTQAVNESRVSDVNDEPPVAIQSE